MGGITLQEDSVQREWLCESEDTMVETVHRFGAKTTQVLSPSSPTVALASGRSFNPCPSPSLHCLICKMRLIKTPASKRNVCVFQLQSTMKIITVDIWGSGSTRQ